MILRRYLNWEITNKTFRREFLLIIVPKSNGKYDMLFQEKHFEKESLIVGQIRFKNIFQPAGRKGGVVR
jgi:hypothetical protein